MSFSKLFLLSLIAMLIALSSCEEGEGPINPNFDVSSTYMKATFNGAYSLSFNAPADDVSYIDFVNGNVTEIEISATILSGNNFYEIKLTIYDKGDNRTRYPLAAGMAKAEVIVSDAVTEEAFDFNATGFIDVVNNNSDYFSGTFSFTIENSEGEKKSITVSNGTFNFIKDFSIIS